MCLFAITLTRGELRNDADPVLVAIFVTPMPAARPYHARMGIENNTAPPTILALWSAPRSRSTAFLRMMAQRGDFTVVHEPFSQVVDFGEVGVGERVVRSEQEAIAALRAMAADGPVFFKDTTDFRFPGVLGDPEFLHAVTHTFIIRHPAEAISSHYALNPALGLDEIGYPWLCELYDAAAGATGTAPVVVDSADLVTDPEATVRAYCAAVGIPFDPAALSWAAGIRPEWQRTRRWHERTGATTGFAEVTAEYADTPENNELLAGYLVHHLPYYERLLAAKLPV
jgi:Sulfotransferase domain